MRHGIQTLELLLINMRTHNTGVSTRGCFIWGFDPFLRLNTRPYTSNFGFINTSFNMVLNLDLAFTCSKEKFDLLPYLIGLYSVTKQCESENLCNSSVYLSDCKKTAAQYNLYWVLVFPLQNEREKMRENESFPD